MTNKVKIYLAVFLLIFSFNAKAVLPLIWAGISAVNTAAGSLSAVEVGVLFAGGAAALYGQQMGYLDLKKDDDSGSIRIPLTNLTRDRPTVDLPAGTPTTKPITNPDTTQVSKVCPAGYSDPPTTQSGCTFITTYSYTKRDEYSCTINFSKSGGAGCDSSNSFVLNSGTAGTTATISSCGAGYTASSGGCTKNPETPSCETGYTSSNGQCVLSEPEKIPDKNCDLQVSTNSSGGKLIKNSSDPDCGSSPVNVSPSGAAHVPVMLPDPETGTPKEHHIIVVPDGGGSNCYYSVCIPIAGLPGHYQIGVHSTGTAPNTTNYQAISVNQDGVVDGVQTGTIAGVIATSGTYVDANGNTQVISPANPVLVQTGANGQLVQAVPAAPAQVINFPSDYARAGEASTAADKIVNKLNESQVNSDLVAPDLVNPLVSYFNPLRAWSVPSQSGQCPTGSFTWNNNEYNFNVMCQLFNENLTLIQGAMTVFYTILALMIVLGA